MQPQGPYPSAPPPQQGTKPRASNFIPLVLATATLVFGSCLAFCGYEIYESETPEGKKAAKEHEEQQAATYDGFLTKMARVRAGLPATDAEAASCPAGTKLGLAPMVDTTFFDSLEDGRNDAGRVPRDESAKILRDSDFSDAILDGELNRAGVDAGLFLTVGFGAIDIETLSKKPFVLVVDPDTFSAPKTDQDGFGGGELSGSLDVVDWATDKTICHAPISVKSSDNISYGGGMQLKFHGIPSPTVGKTDLDEAIAKDFKENLKAASKNALAVIGAQ